MRPDYRVLPGLMYTPAQAALARRYERVEDAVRDMGEGVVFDGPRLVAFHERHLSVAERLAAL